MKIAKESWLIALLGIADLITTIVFIRHHGAEEANPLFHFLWVIGLPAFILAKIIFIVGPISILEWARSERPRFVKWASRTAIFGYMVCYGMGFAKLNGPSAQAQEVNGAQYPTAPMAVSDFTIETLMHGPGKMQHVDDFKRIWRREMQRRSRRWDTPKAATEQVVLESNL